MLVIIGHASIDETVNRYGESSIAPSGAGYISAVGATLITKNVGLVTRVGADYDINTLQKLNIDLSGLKVDLKGKTARFKLVYRYDNDTERDFFAQFNVAKDLNPEDIPKSYLEKADYVHISTMPPLQQREFVNFFRANRPSLPLSIDTLEQYVESNHNQVLDNFRNVDLIFVDLNEYKRLPKEVFQGKKVLLKKGKDGATYIDGDTEISSPATPVERVIDKTGSGDILAGTFLAGILTNSGIEISLRRACRNASESIKSFGVEHLITKKVTRKESEI